MEITLVNRALSDRHNREAHNRERKKTKPTPKMKGGILRCLGGLFSSRRLGYCKVSLLLLHEWDN